MGILSTSINGKIKVIEPIITGTTKKGDEWAKIALLIASDDEYSNEVLVDFFKIGDNVKYVKDLPSIVKVGDSINCEVNVTSKEITKKDGGKMYITTCGAWKVSKNEAPNSDGGEEKVPVGTQAYEDTGSEDDLPF